MYKQLNLFGDEAAESLQIVYEALRRKAALGISVSGGKDSQALLNYLCQQRSEHQWEGECFAIHADLGRAEWKQTPQHVEKITQFADISLVVVRREKGDLIARFQERKEQLNGQNKPFWSDSKNRYCTSDMKREPINKYLRGFSFVISAEGVRAQESTNRSKKPVLKVREEISSKLFHGLTPQEALDKWDLLQESHTDKKPRLAFTWNAIHDWNLEQVWKMCGTSLQDVRRRQTLFRQGQTIEALEGFPAHPAYIFGNQRLSCALCILATKSDLLNGARYNPEVFQELLEMEKTSGWSFKKDLSLQKIEEILRLENQ
jgi:3'-phosphoadenosine 5'-phosphosulfate sulfotransferase (PAPS reductase)/FAD synthetase